MSMDSKTTLVQVRMSETEKATLQALAKRYGMDVSEFFRQVVLYIEAEQPALVRPIVAPIPEMADAQIQM